MSSQTEIVTEVVDGFTNSVFVMFFPNITTNAGTALLEALVCYMLECYPDIRERCPRLWKCFYLNWLASTLSSWPVGVSATEDGDGTVNVDTDAIGAPKVYLSKRTIGGKQCEWKAYDHKCDNCEDDIKTGWSREWRKALADCEQAQAGLFLGGGSNFPGRKRGGCCGSDKWL